MPIDRAAMAAIAQVLAPSLLSAQVLRSSSAYRTVRPDGWPTFARNVLTGTAVDLVRAFSD